MTDKDIDVLASIIQTSLEQQGVVKPEQYPAVRRAVVTVSEIEKDYPKFLRGSA